MDSFDFSNIPIEAIYQAIGQTIVGAIADEWTTATVYAEIDDDNGLVYGRYSTQNHPDQSLSFDTDYVMYLAFDELCTRLQKPNELPWHKAQFTLHRNGKFDLTFTYPDKT